MRFVFWALLCANALLFAYGRGMLGTVDTELHEPARLGKELAADKLVLLSSAQAQALADAAVQSEAVAEASSEDSSDSAAAATPAASPEPAPASLACVETDALAPNEARRFEARLARLALGERQTRLGVPFQEVTSHLVYLAPQGGKEGAERRTAQLRERGVANSFVMQGESPLKWAISLGVFKSETAAKGEAARLEKLGVANVRVLARGPQSQRYAYRFRDIDSELRRRILEAGKGAPAPLLLHTCR